MSDIVEKIRLILVDTIENKNRFWNADLYSDDRVYCNWGRVGATIGQSKTFSGGKRYLDKQVASKKRKGYVESQTIQENETKVVSNDLSSVVKKELQFSSPLLEKLVDRLVKANIHQITSNTKITYNNTSGLFSTPLGVVTIEGINRAKIILDDVSNNLHRSKTSEFYNLVNQYLMIVPQKVGKSLQLFVDNNFASKENIADQKDILDALEVSYKTINSQTHKPNVSVEQKEEKLFDVTIHLLENKKEYDRLVKNFENSKKSIHHYDNIKVKNIYTVNLGQMSATFNRGGWGNVKEYYHGSNLGNILSILKDGLKIRPPSTARKAGSLFGSGIYGADSSSKSLGYSLGRWGQGRSNDGAWLFVCDFAMGKTYMADSYGGGRYPVNGYDSTTALASKTNLFNNEYIVYKNEQVNIKYLIECE